MFADRVCDCMMLCSWLVGLCCAFACEQSQVETENLIEPLSCGDATSGNIRVFCRFRPRLPNEAEEAKARSDRGTPSGAAKRSLTFGVSRLFTFG